MKDYGEAHTEGWPADSLQVVHIDCRTEAAPVDNFATDHIETVAAELVGCYKPDQRRIGEGEVDHIGSRLVEMVRLYTEHSEGVHIEAGLADSLWEER